MLTRSLICAALMTLGWFVMITANGNALQLSETRGGKLIQDYITALNSGDEATMRAYLETNVAPAALKNRPVAPRLAIMLDLHQRWQSATINEVASATDTTTTALITTKAGDWFAFTMLHDRSEPAKMLGIQIEDVEPPSTVKLQPLTSKQLLTEVAAALDSHSKADDFSGVALVAHNGKPVFFKAYGFADTGLKVSNKLDTKFNLGSINKKFTEIGIEMLIAQGKLSYSDTLGKLLPDYPNREAASKVTVRHLLQMQGGIGDFFGEAFDATPKDNLRHNNDFIPLFANEKLHFEPGTNSEYSNGGYILLGAIIEKASGMDYYDFIRANIFEPAGMSNTDWFETDSRTPNLAEGYTLEGAAGGKRISNVHTRPARGSAAGGGYSTAEDLLKFVNAAADGKFGAASEHARGLGIAGGAPGINAALESDLKGGYTVIVLSNYDPPSAEKIARELRQLISRVTN